MRSIKVKDVMVPLSEYATVEEDATLYDAVLALEDAQEKYQKGHYKHRAILVFDANRKITGKISQLDLIRGLEAGYQKIGDLKYVSHSGFTVEFIKSMIKNYGLWERPLSDICRKAATIRVKDIMYTPTEGEYVPEEASLDEAVHQLVIGHHHSLLVTKGEDIVGILRLSDIFTEICDQIKTCEI